MLGIVYCEINKKIHHDWFVSCAQIMHLSSIGLLLPTGEMSHLATTHVIVPGTHMPSDDTVKQSISLPNNRIFTVWFQEIYQNIIVTKALYVGQVSSLICSFL